MTDSFALFEALRAGDPHTVRAAVDADPSCATARDPEGLSLLMLALYHRQNELAQHLLGLVDSLDVWEVTALGRLGDLAGVVGQAPSAITSRSPDGFTPLHLAAFFGHPDLVEWLLRQGAPVDAVAANPSLVRPLHSAVAAGSVRVAQLLLQSGADPDAVQRGGWTPLHGAARRGDLDLVELLLRRGADPEKASDDGRRAIDLAGEHGHRHVVERLAG